MSNTIGKLIRFKRENLGLTQKDVAQAMGFSNVFLGRVEFGKTPLPLSHVNKLAKVLKLTRQEILFAIKHDVNNRIDGSAG